MDLKESLKYIKLQERTVSLVIGIVVIILSIGLLYKYFSNPSQIKDTFQTFQFGEITPNLTSAYPNDSTSTISVTESVTPTLVPQVAVNNPANTTSTSTEAKTHTVLAGDNLWKIAEQYFQSGYNWVDIAQANKLSSPDKLTAGQTIFIPNVNPKQNTVIVASSKVENPINDANYTVVEGDSLWNIAVRAYGDGFKWSEIARENNITTPNLIYSGTTLKIPR